MENECKCPKCPKYKKQDLVCPATIGGYVCIRCCYIFDGKERKDDRKNN